MAFSLPEDASPIKEGGESLALSVRALRLAVHRALLGSVLRDAAPVKRGGLAPCHQSPL